MATFNQMQLDKDWMRSRYPDVSMEAAPDNSLILVFLGGELFGSVPESFRGARDVAVTWHQWRWDVFENYLPTGRVAGQYLGQC